MNKDKEIEYLEGMVKLHKDFGNNMYKMGKRNLEDFIFYNKINMAMYIVWFLMGIALGIQLA